MTKPRTAKDCLMEAASLNPAECLAVTIVNGELRISYKYDNIQTAVFMLWALDKALNEDIQTKRIATMNEKK